MEAYWLVKSEPQEYSFDDLIKDKKVDWTGVRNYQARNYMKEMKIGDKVLFYHSYQDKRIVGIAIVARGFFPDPLAVEKDWIAVQLSPEQKFEKPIGLEDIKKSPSLQSLPLIKQPRLSVMPVSKEEFNLIVLMSKQ
jgi:predicted RNA-binding protein with PUA-like domain